MKTAQMRTTADQAMALMRHHIDARISDTIAIVGLTQVYRNDFGTNIEAVYAFPLPLHAQLLDLEIRIGNVIRKGVVLANDPAQGRYEQAVNNGDTAILLEQKQSGLFVLNLGNLMDGEDAEIHLRYALALSWEDDLLRIALPTTIAPRYGSWERGGVGEHEQPSIDPLLERASTLAVEIAGTLAQAEIRSPTHEIVVDRGQYRAGVRLLQGRMWMDRDFVVTLRSPQATPSFCRQVSDGAEHVVYLSARLPATESETQAARSVKIVIDCSGSMAGDAIAQARVAALKVLATLRPTDKVGVVAFGDSARCHSVVMVPASGTNLPDIGAWIGGLRADMGGTEIEQALQFAYSIRGELSIHDVLLISDGNIANPDSVISAARSSGHRLFVIGVGASPAEGNLRRLGEATDGAVAFVTPNEDMGTTIERHFGRITQPRVVGLDVEWPSEVLWQVPSKPRSLFAGDTVHMFATFPVEIGGRVQLKVRYDDGSSTSFAVDVSPDAQRPDNVLPSDIRRLAAGHRLLDMQLEAASQGDMEQWAVRHQLVSRFTSYVVAIHRDEDAAVRTPQLKRVSSMQAAGWAGAGSVISAVQMKRSVTVDLGRRLARPSFSRLEAPSSFNGTQYRRAASAIKPPAEFIGLIGRDSAHRWWRSVGLDDLTTLGVPDDLVAYLQALAGYSRADRDVALAFVLTLIDGPLGSLFSEELREGFRSIEALGDELPEIIREMAPRISSITAESWGASIPEAPSAAGQLPEELSRPRPVPTTVASFAAELNRPASELVAQFRGAGVAIESVDSEITPADKLALLTFLRARPKF